MLHLYFLSVGPVLDPVGTGCRSPPVACGSRLSIDLAWGLWVDKLQWLSFAAPVAFVPVAVVRSTPVAVVPGAPVAVVPVAPVAVDRLQWLSFDLLQWLSFDRLRWLLFQWLHQTEVKYKKQAPQNLRLWE